MKSPYVSEVEANRVINTSFLVHSKEIRQKKSGEFYLSLLLGDRSGELDAKMWDNVNDVLDAFERDDFVKVKGLIQIFHNRPQLTIHKMRRLHDSEIDYTDYFPCSRRDPGEMWRELQSTIAGIGNPHLKGLLESLLGDPDVAARYRRAPAAKQIHHAFLGGLIEHVLSLCAMARLAASHYRNVDLDLLLTGVVLHDIGKIYELSYDRGFSYTTEGQLIGHISIAMRMIGDKIRCLPDFPAPLRTLVEHMVLSHHGHLEFGSPKVPMFPEALLLHYLDDLDSKMESMRALIENDRQVEGCFTSYNNALERTALKKDRFLHPPVEPAAQSAPPVEAKTPSGPPLVPNGATPAAPLVPNGAPPSAQRQPSAAAPEAPAPTASAPVTPAPNPPPAPHPLFASKPNSAFADKLRQALGPAAPKQES